MKTQVKIIMGKNECEQKEGWKMMMRMMDFDDVYEYTILRHIFTRWKKRPDTHTHTHKGAKKQRIFILSLSFGCATHIL